MDALERCLSGLRAWGYAWWAGAEEKFPVRARVQGTRGGSTVTAEGGVPRECPRGPPKIGITAHPRSHPTYPA